MALAAAPGSSGEGVAEAMGMDRMTVSRTLEAWSATAAPNAAPIPGMPAATGGA